MTIAHQKVSYHVEAEREGFEPLPHLFEINFIAILCKPIPHSLSTTTPIATKVKN